MYNRKWTIGCRLEKQLLSDNQVTLSTMKASRFVKPFEQEVDKWERALSLIMEVIEMILTVQRQWMYLEVSFLYFCKKRI